LDFTLKARVHPPFALPVSTPSGVSYRTTPRTSMDGLVPQSDIPGWPAPASDGIELGITSPSVKQETEAPPAHTLSLEWNQMPELPLPGSHDTQWDFAMPSLQLGALPDQASPGDVSSDAMCS
jgi:hypothetical protein